MTALLAPPATRPALSPPPEAEQRLVVGAVSWQSYVAVGEAFRDRSAIRLTYDRGTLEIRTTSPAHEKYKEWLGQIIYALADVLNVPIEAAGRMTFQRADLERGLEPDQCYWIAHEARVRGCMDWLPDRDPPPDLVGEIEVSRSAVNRMGIYAALGCPEVWRFNGESLRVEVLQADGSYHLVGAAFRFLPSP